MPPDALNPDGSDAGPAPGAPASLQPWDKARYVWRGTMRWVGELFRPGGGLSTSFTIAGATDAGWSLVGLELLVSLGAVDHVCHAPPCHTRHPFACPPAHRVSIRQLSASLAAGLAPAPADQEPRATLSLNTLTATVVDRKSDVTLTGLTVMALSQPPGGNPGDPLLALPFAYIPMLMVGAHLAWKLPGSRDPSQHHLFPSYPLDQIAAREAAPPQVGWCTLKLRLLVGVLEPI